MKTFKLLVYSFAFLLALQIMYSQEEQRTLRLEDIKCGTFLPEKKKKEIINELMAWKNPRSSGMQTYYDTPSGCFRIHYDTVNAGEFDNAVNPIDNDYNGIPDYVDSAAYYAEFAYDYYVEQLGYFSPCPDVGKGGSEAYDIYLIDLGNGDSGSTFYGFTVEDGTILPNRKFERWYSYLILDNNYSPLDSTSFSDGSKVQTFKTFNINALKITMVHEIHHSIQFKYGESLPPVHMMNEISSTYYEWEIFPEELDYLQYVKNLFRNFEARPFGNGYFENGYSWSIFGQFMSKKYSPMVIKRMWELIYDGIQTYNALDSAFKEHDSSLPQAWCEFLPWLYYTGERAKGSDYFDQAAIFPEMTFYRNDAFSSPSFSDNGNLSPFEVRGFRCFFSSDEDFATEDTLDFVMTNTDLFAATNQTKRKSEYTFLIADSHIPNTIRIENSDYFYSLDSEIATFCNSYFFNTGVSTGTIGTTFPNPYRPGIDDALFFPAPVKAEIYDEVTVKIYSADMLEIYSMDLQVTVWNSFRVLRCDNVPNEFESGVYVYYYKDFDELGKFAILR